MYSLKGVLKALRSPRIAINEVNRIFNNGRNYRTARTYNENGVDILKGDWDNLIILDACRYDTFKEFASHLSGKLEKRESKASATSQFLKQNFGEKDIYDTIYITSNPQLYRLENGIYDSGPINVKFHAQFDVWQDNWDEEHRTVRPEVVTETTLREVENYPNKRFIIHYLQPHAPYIGPTGVEHLPTDYLNFWGSFQKGKIDVDLEVVKQAYEENLDLVLPHVEKLLNALPGKTVVTADHGELLGERDSPIPIKQYGHPPYTYIPELVTIPWHVYQNGGRKTITAETPEMERDETVEEDVVKERLQHLGYTE